MAVEVPPDGVVDHWLPGWKWDPHEDVYVWWDGEQYTHRATWEGWRWRLDPAGPRDDGSTGSVRKGLAGVGVALGVVAVVMLTLIFMYMANEALSVLQGGLSV